MEGCTGDIHLSCDRCATIWHQLRPGSAKPLEQIPDDDLLSFARDWFSWVS
jgi:hypothetical protein